MLLPSKEMDMGKQGTADGRFERLLRQIGYAVLRLQRENTDTRNSGVRVTDVRFKLDADNRTSVLVILKGVADDGEKVAFVGGPDLESAVIAVGKRLEGETLRWREDRPWGAA